MQRLGSSQTRSFCKFDTSPEAAIIKSIPPTSPTFHCYEQGKKLVLKLKDCSRSRDLEKGKEIHSQIIEAGLFWDTILANTLISFYAKCKSIVEAQVVFDSMLRRDVVSWNCLLQGYVENGQMRQVMDLLQEMEAHGFIPDGRTYVSAIIACTGLATETVGNQTQQDRRWLEKGKALHRQAVSCRCCDIFVESQVIEMYARLGDMVQARSVFDSMLRHDIVSWNCLLQGYLENGQNKVALQIFDSMGEAGCEPDTRAYTTALRACAGLGSGGNHERGIWLEKGRVLHSQAVKNRCCDSNFVLNTLIDMYAKCGSMLDSRSVFDNMARHDVVSWNCLLQGYVENGDSSLALELFQDMQRSGECAPDDRTYVVALSACASLGNSEKGRALYLEAAGIGCSSCYVENMVINMFVKSGCMEQALQVFDKMLHRNVVSWTLMLQGYVENGDSRMALELYEGMVKEDGCVLDARAYVAVLTACSTLASKKDEGVLNKQSVLTRGKAIHSKAVATGCVDIFVENTMIGLYAHCGSMKDARSVFDGMARRDLVSWNCLIQGYVENGENELALELFTCLGNVAPDSATYVAGLMACGSLTDVHRGKALHAEILRCGLEREAMVLACLVEFYGKCSNMEAAEQVFEVIFPRDMFSWNGLLCGYSQPGNVGSVWEVFERMLDQGGYPNDITFTHLLTACSHAGLTDKGKECFDSMVKFGVGPNVIHYTCMVDMFARGNYLKEALATVKTMPYEADCIMWTAILSACLKWNNVAIGEVAYEALLRLDRRNSRAYVLMANIYEGAGMKNESNRVLLASKQCIFKR